MESPHHPATPPSHVRSRTCAMPTKQHMCAALLCSNLILLMHSARISNTTSSMSFPPSGRCIGFLRSQSQQPTCSRRPFMRAYSHTSSDYFLSGPYTECWASLSATHVLAHFRTYHTCCMILVHTILLQTF